MIAAYIFIWALASVFLSVEYWNLIHHPKASLILHLQQLGYISPSVVINTEPGRSLSLWLGWMGLGLMILMNLYSIRKRSQFMRGLGSLKGWLNFHVFCGILGPTLIVFHSGFKVRGIVAISFWSMMISLSSGIIGRYFYVQILTQKKDLEILASRVLAKLDNILALAQVKAEETQKAFFVTNALRLAGVPTGNAGGIGVVSAIFRSMVGDARLMFGSVPIGSGWPMQSAEILRAYAVVRRKALFLSAFQKLMGYWHAFHFPFAVFMYVAAIIHVAAALVLGV